MYVKYLSTDRHFIFLLGLVLTVRGRMIEDKEDGDGLDYLPLSLDGSHKNSKENTITNIQHTVGNSSVDHDRTSHNSMLDQRDTSQVSIAASDDERLSGRSTTIANPLSYPQQRISR